MMEGIERKKYEEVWESKEYRRSPSPGEMLLKRLPIVSWLKDFEVETILDAGCGEGRLLRGLKKINPEWQVRGIDIAENAIDPRIKDIFKQGCLWEDESYDDDGYDAIICTDVLEHIPTDHVMDVLHMFRKYSNKCVFLSISLVDDIFGGKLIGEPLHLTVREYYWWQEKIRMAGFEVRYAMIHPQLFDCFLVRL